MRIEGGRPSEMIEVFADRRVVVWLLPPLTVLCLFLVIIKVIIGPKLVEVKAFRDKERGLRAEIKTMTEKQQYLEALRSTDLSGKEILVDSSLLREKDAYWLVNLLKLLADKHQFSLQSFSISPGILVGPNQGKAEEKGLIGVGAGVSFVGSKDKYVDFLLNVESVLPVLSIDKLEIRSSGEAVVELQMTVTAYYHQEILKKEVGQLSLADLRGGAEEGVVLERLVSFENLTNFRTPVGSLMGGDRKFSEYNRNNPFSF